MSLIRLQEAIDLGLVPLSAMNRFPAVGRSRLFGSPLTLGGFRPFFPGTGPLQRPESAYNRFGIAPLRFGLGSLGLGLGLSPSPSAIGSPGVVPSGSGISRRRRTEDEEAAAVESLRRGGALPTESRSRAATTSAQAVAQVQRAAQQAAAQGDSPSQVLSQVKGGLSLIRQVADPNSLANQIVEAAFGMTRGEFSPEVEQALREQRAGEREDFSRFLVPADVRGAFTGATPETLAEIEALRGLREGTPIETIGPSANDILPFEFEPPRAEGFPIEPGVLAPTNGDQGSDALSQFGGPALGFATGGLGLATGGSDLAKARSAAQVASAGTQLAARAGVTGAQTVAEYAPYVGTALALAQAGQMFSEDNVGGGLASLAGLAVPALGLVFGAMAAFGEGPLAPPPPSNWDLFGSRVRDTLRGSHRGAQSLIDETKAAKTRGDLQLASANYLGRLSDLGIGNIYDRVPVSRRAGEDFWREFDSNPTVYLPTPPGATGTKHEKGLVADFDPAFAQVRTGFLDLYRRLPSGGPSGSIQDYATFKAEQTRQADAALATSQLSAYQQAGFSPEQAQRAIQNPGAEEFYSPEGNRLMLPGTVESGGGA